MRIIELLEKLDGIVDPVRTEFERVDIPRAQRDDRLTARN